MPQLLRFLLRHALIGFGLAILFTGSILVLDMAGLGTLVWNSPLGWVAVAVLTFATGLTFGSAQMGIAVMSLGEENGGGGRALRLPVRRPHLRPVTVRAAAGDRRQRGLNRQDHADHWGLR